MKKDYFLGVSEEGFHRVVYREWGTPNDTHIPIVCVHGLTRNSSDFDDLAQYLTHFGYHVFCPDVVGRGDSDWLKNPQHYTYEQYIADMNTLIARTQSKQVDWIGTSMGGLIGMVMASLPNNPIRRLILNDIGPQIPTKGLARLSRYVGKDPVFVNIEEAKNYFKTICADFGHLTETQWQRFTENSIYEVSSGQFMIKADPGVKIATAKSQIAWQTLLHPIKALEGALFDIDLWQNFRNITCPILVIHGQKSDILLSSTILKMQKIHPNTDVVEIEGVGHAPPLLDSAQHEIIYQWLIK